jgi:hypothetical protein
VFQPTDPATNPADLPDDYFELTKTELKAAFNSQRKLRESLVDAPLKTQSMRQAEERRKLQRWPNVCPPILHQWIGSSLICTGNNSREVSRSNHLRETLRILREDQVHLCFRPGISP